MRIWNKTISLGVMVVFGLGISGCETMNEHRIATGAIGGATLGAIAGALIADDSVKGGLIGAAIGGAVGTGVGYILQKQKDRYDRVENVQTIQQPFLIQPPATAPPQVQPDGTTQPAPLPPPVEVEALTLRLSNEVLYEKGSSALSPSGARKIAEIGVIMNDYPDADVYVQGYSSSEGADATNQALSQRRADIVRNHLITGGVAPQRIYAMGMGESNPIADNNTEIGRMSNRRVEINIVPREG